MGCFLSVRLTDFVGFVLLFLPFVRSSFLAWIDSSFLLVDKNRSWISLTLHSLSVFASQSIPNCESSIVSHTILGFSQFSYVLFKRYSECVGNLYLGRVMSFALWWFWVQIRFDLCNNTKTVGNLPKVGVLFYVGGKIIVFDYVFWVILFILFFEWLCS